jgi:hypothetical protein
MERVKAVRGLPKLSTKAGPDVFGLAHSRVLGLLMQVGPLSFSAVPRQPPTRSLTLLFECDPCSSLTRAFARSLSAA